MKNQKQRNSPAKDFTAKTSAEAGAHALDFSQGINKPVRAEFDGGTITSDAGCLLLRQSRETGTSGVTTRTQNVTWNYDEVGNRTWQTSNYAQNTPKKSNYPSAKKMWVEVRTETTGVGASAVSHTTRFLNDENFSFPPVLEERDASGALEARYLNDADGEQLRQEHSGAEPNTWIQSYVLEDGTQSVRQLSNGDGSLSDAYAFDAWGNSAGSVGTTPNRFGFNGQQQDSTGLTYLRARYYNSGTDRFWGQDPDAGDMMEPGTLQRYRYSGNDPVNRMDPSVKFDMSLAGLTTSLGIQDSLRNWKNEATKRGGVLTPRFSL